MSIKSSYFIANGSSARRFGNALRQEVVVGRLRGLSTEETATKESAYKTLIAKLATDGFAPGQPHPSDSSMILQETNLVPVAPGSDSYDARMLFTTPTGLTPSVLIIDIDGALQAVETDKDPLTGEPLYTGWEGVVDVGDGSSEGMKVIKPAIPPDLAVRSKMRPITRVSGIKTFFRADDESTVVAGARVMGRVNAAPFLGRPRGAWLMTQYKTTINRYLGTSALRLEAMTKSLDPEDLAEGQRSEDWRTAIVLRDRRTGRVAQLTEDKDVDGETVVGTQTKYNGALDAPYAHGVIKGAGLDYDPATAGFVVLGDYPVGDFDAYWSALDLS